MDKPTIDYNLVLPPNVEMFVKTITDNSEFPIAPENTNNELYKKLVYFEVPRGIIGGTTKYKVVPFWKIWWQV